MRASGAQDVAVVIPAYNAARYIRDSIESVLRQTWRPGQLIVVDDGSTDGTVELLQGYTDVLQLIRQSRRGVSRARNAGAAVANLRWLAFLDADDIWLPQRLERQLTAFNGSAQLLWCGLVVADSDLRPLRRLGVPNPSHALRNTLLLEPPPVSVSVAALVSRDAFHDVGGFPEGMTHAEDADLVVRLLSRYEGQALDEDLVLYRTHPGQATRDVAAIERGWRQLIVRCFEGRLLPPELQELRPRTLANMHGSLAGEHAARGHYGKALQHGLRSARADPRRAGEFVARRVRRLLHTHSSLAAVTRLRR